MVKRNLPTGQKLSCHPERAPAYTLTNLRGHLQPFSGFLSKKKPLAGMIIPCQAKNSTKLWVGITISFWIQERPGSPGIYLQWNSDQEAAMALLEGLGRGYAWCCCDIHPCQDGSRKEQAAALNRAIWDRQQWADAHVTVTFQSLSS